MTDALDLNDAPQPTGLTLRQLCECLDCGQRQVVPALRPGTVARCLRCDRLLRRARRNPLGQGAGAEHGGSGPARRRLPHAADDGEHQRHEPERQPLLGPQSLRSDGLWELSAVVLFTSVAAPVAKAVAMTYVLAGLQFRRPWWHLRQIFAWIEWLRPWSMVEVYLLGIFVAYVKLIALVHIELGPALYALGALMLVMVAADAVLDRQAVWEALDRQDPSAQPASNGLLHPWPGAIACEVCGLLGQPDRDGPVHCRRCGAHLHARKPNSIARAWALMIAATILYGPANIYPVLTVIQLGAGAPSTIMGGVVELLSSGMYPLAALVFCASVVVPVLKLVALGAMLVATWLGSARPAARSHPSLPHRRDDRTLVDDRRLHGLDPGRAGAVSAAWSTSAPTSARSPSPAW